jgi:transglutaminase-like putative cysteine protease
MCRHVLRSLVVLLLVARAATAQQPAQKIEATDLQTVSATITYELKTKNFAPNKWMIFLPEPPELPSQGKIKVTADPVGQIVLEKSLIERRLRYIEIPVAEPVRGGSVSMKLEIEATLRSRKLVALKRDEEPPAVDPLTAAERKYYLSSTTSVDHDAKTFQEWLDAKKLRRAKTESPLDFSARLLEVLRADYRYHFDAEEDKRASIACGLKATDCGGMSCLFAAAMRANDVPARVIVGRLALPRKPGSKPSDTGYDQPHIRAEMYLAGIGWVPVDPARANGNRNKPVRDYIGADPGDLLVLHLDVDLQLPFPDKVRESKVLQLGPHYWTTGRGTFDGSAGPTGWELKAAPINKK